jgi:hypothetical protein
MYAIGHLISDAAVFPPMPPHSPFGFPPSRPRRRRGPSLRARLVHLWSVPQGEPFLPPLRNYPG